MPSTYLLLLHQLRIRAVVHDILSKHRRSQHGIDLLRIDVLQLPIEDKIISLSSQIHRGLLPKQDEREDIAILNPSLSAHAQS
jgi:hypothetical protein